MKRYILLSVLLISVNTFASINEGVMFRSELNSALDSLDMNYVESSSTKSSWYIKNIWLEFNPYVSFKVPGLLGLKITPTFRIFLKRALRPEDQDYEPRVL